jgi:NAD-dependent deacetylase
VPASRPNRECPTFAGRRFGQALVPEVIDRAMRAAAEADILLAVGSTLQVYPVAGAVPRAKAAGARIVIINAEPTGFDDIASSRD